MAKVDYRRLPDTKRAYHVAILQQIFDELDIESGGQDFFLDLFMESEVTMFARRIEIARLLILGYSFENIRQALGVGFDNIISVDCWLNARLHSYRAILCPDVIDQRKPHELSSVINLARKKYPDRRALLDILLRV